MFVHFSSLRMYIVDSRHERRHIFTGADDLEEVLGTLVQGAVSFPDPTVCYSTEIMSTSLTFDIHAQSGL